MSPLTRKRVNNYKKPSLKDHCFLSSHVCSSEGFTVLNFESQKFKHVIRESLLATDDKALFNKQNFFDSIPLKLFYYTLFYYTYLQLPNRYFY